MQSYCYTYLFVRLAESLNIVTVLERRPCNYFMTQNWKSKNIVTLVLNWDKRWFILASALAGVMNEYTANPFPVQITGISLCSNSTL